MFIHIGDENVIRSKDIVSIIDLNVIDSSPIIEEMIAHHQQSGRLIGSKKDAKSIVITPKDIYYSPLAIPTLKKRDSIISMISGLDDYSNELEDEENLNK